MNISQMLIGTLFGDVLLWTREREGLIRSALFNPEKLGTLSNDVLAAKLVTSICEPGKTFVDVGAHIGSVAAAAKKRSPQVKLIAVEADPVKAIRLKRKFPNDTILGFAVSDVCGVATFYVDTKQSGYSSLSPTKNGHVTREIQVEVRRLDDIIPQDAPVDTMKVDIEGAELAALRGSIELLARCAPIVMFESGPASPDAKADLHHFFCQQDYTVLVPNRLAHNDVGLSKDGFLESHLYPRRTTNYFAVPNFRRLEVRDKARKALKISAG